jgi:hypothetical protein
VNGVIRTERRIAGSVKLTLVDARWRGAEIRTAAEWPPLRKRFKALGKWS